MRHLSNRSLKFAILLSVIKRTSTCPSDICLTLDTKIEKLFSNQ